MPSSARRRIRALPYWRLVNVSFFLYPEAIPRLALQYRSGSLPLAAERGVVRLRRPVAVERQQLESG